MAACGVPEVDIARVVDIDPKTLRKHYRDELDTGQIKATAKVAESLFRKATGEGREAVVAAIFWLKTRAGWKETSVQEHTGEGTVVFKTILETLPPPNGEVLELQAVERPAYPWDQA